ncbi:unnamed protein product [Blepharisma stoltei]|uniref:Uncharacterized protein n=1 Tax=Blepharisma stoltei TaxID=1481888 RepID=A0AAU9JRH6_9CILI|nr:unnamed protein product [Blepharisma stoltei]
MEAIKLLRKQIYRVSPTNDQSESNRNFKNFQISPKNNHLATVDYSLTFDFKSEQDLSPPVRLHAYTQVSLKPPRNVFRNRFSSKQIIKRDNTDLKEGLNKSISAISYRDKSFCRSYSPTAQQHKMVFSFRKPEFIAQINESYRGIKTPKNDYFKDNSDFLLEGKRDNFLYKSRPNSRVANINKVIRNTLKKIEKIEEKNKMKIEEDVEEFKPCLPIVHVKNRHFTIRFNKNSNLRIDTNV